jgi:hypothetical protein
MTADISIKLDKGNPRHPSVAPNSMAAFSRWLSLIADRHEPGCLAIQGLAILYRKLGLHQLSRSGRKFSNATV